MITDIPANLAHLSMAQAQARLKHFGPNVLARSGRWAWFKDVFNVVSDPMALMLAAAGSVYLMLGETSDGIIMLSALVPVLGVDVFLEARSRAALKKLAQAVAAQASVVRDGRIQSVPTSELVPGDLLVLEEGCVVHADGVLRWTANLTLDESQLTGESEPQIKQAATVDAVTREPSQQFFAGSMVLAGHGFGEINQTGVRTRFGEIATLVAEADTSATPLQKKTSRLVRRLTIVAIMVAVGIFVLGLAHHLPWARALLEAISVAMAAIPEEFPLVFTLFLSAGAWRLSAKGVLARRLASVETLGSTTIICTDKTGTLTTGQFVLDEHVCLAAELSTLDLLEAAVLACEPHPSDPMERAVVNYAEAHGVNVAALMKSAALVYDYDFDPIGKHMSHVWSRGERMLIVAKGALEGVLAHCELGADARGNAEKQNALLAARGMRVLALAGRDLGNVTGVREHDETQLKIYGLLGFGDPLRPEVPPAVRECESAGIRIKMITGDHALTAHAIADASGMTHDEDGIVRGEDLEKLSTDAFDGMARHASIFARISPAQKYALIKSLKSQGEIVAMTGDGINDAPALRLADIGISMGKRGSEVARASADLILLDDNFASIVAAIREGRHIFANIQTAFLYILAFHVPIVGLALLAPLTGLPLLLLPVHLVWLELIIHPVSAIVFQGEPAPRDIMGRAPRKPSAPLLSTAAMLRSVAMGATLTVAVYGVYRLHIPSGDTHARALAISVLMGGYQVMVWIERAALKPRGTPFFTTRLIAWLVWLIAGFSLPLVLYTPLLARMLHVEALGWGDMMMALSIAFAATSWRFLLDRIRPLTG